jgi:hypothetical protein
MILDMCNGNSLLPYHHRRHNGKQSGISASKSLGRSTVRSSSGAEGQLMLNSLLCLSPTSISLLVA